MKRRKNRDRQAPEESTAKVDISSLVDVSFLLLIYFIVAATIQKKEQDLDMVLPTGGLGQGDPLIVQLEDDGKIVANPSNHPELISPARGDSQLASLAQRIQFLRASQGDLASVILRVSPKVNYQRFIDVINCLAGEEMTKLAIVDIPER